MITVRAAIPSDAAAWSAMRAALWPESDADEHRREIADYFAGRFCRGPWIALVSEPVAEPVAQPDAAGPAALLGFAEVSIRPYAEGCTSSRVAYLEGWYVVPQARGRGVGAALITVAQRWGRAYRCSEFASDADPGNDVSRRAHGAVGFSDAGLVRCFRKEL